MIVCAPLVHDRHNWYSISYKLVRSTRVRSPEGSREKEFEIISASGEKQSLLKRSQELMAQLSGSWLEKISAIVAILIMSALFEL